MIAPFENQVVTSLSTFMKNWDLGSDSLQKNSPNVYLTATTSQGKGTDVEALAVAVVLLRPERFSERSWKLQVAALGSELRPRQRQKSRAGYTMTTCMRSQGVKALRALRACGGILFREQKASKKGYRR